MAEFAVSGRWFKWHGHALGCVVIIAADNAEVPPTQHVVFRAKDLAYLKGITPDALRLVHETKKHFEGDFVGTGNLFVEEDN